MSRASVTRMSTVMFRDTYEANEAAISRGFAETVRRIASRLAGGAA